MRVAGEHVSTLSTKHEIERDRHSPGAMPSESALTRFACSQSLNHDPSAYPVVYDVLVLVRGGRVRSLSPSHEAEPTRSPPDSNRFSSRGCVLSSQQCCCSSRSFSCCRCSCSSTAAMPQLRILSERMRGSEQQGVSCESQCRALSLSSLRLLTL